MLRNFQLILYITELEQEMSKSMNKRMNNRIAIVEAKVTTMREAKNKGCKCPVCGQFVKIYKRSINSTMSLQLLKAFKKYDVGKSFHITDIIEGGDGGGGGDFSKLRYWGLIVELENDNPKKKNSGRWIVTTNGELFIKGIIKLKKFALIYNGKFIDFDGDEVMDFKSTLGKNFDYQYLMNA